MSKTGVSASTRRQVFERAKGCCEYCRSQADFATQAFSIEHIAPKAKGGNHALENLALACQGCNAHKSTKSDAQDPLTQQVVPLFNPRQQYWPDHFAWDEQFTQILGLTATG